MVKRKGRCLLPFSGNSFSKPSTSFSPFAHSCFSNALYGSRGGRDADDDTLELLLLVLGHVLRVHGLLPRHL